MDSLKTTLRNNLIYSRDEIAWYEKFHRFGAKDPYNAIGTTREYTFFTKPDCHIFNPGTNTLSSVFANDPFFVDMKERYPYVLHSLQRSSKSGNTNFDSSPFINILSNGLRNSVDLQGLTATEMDNAVNIYGTSIPYRKDAWVGDEGIDISLEFEDTKYAEIYLLTKAYEEYERKVQMGLVYPPDYESQTVYGTEGFNYFGHYIKFKELHDTFGIFRFIVDEDMETLLYWAYLTGVYFKSVPRDAFNDLSGGLTMAVDFHAFNVTDMNPLSLGFFNDVVHSIDSERVRSNHTYIPVYDETTQSVNGAWGLFPYIVKVYMDKNNPWYCSKGMKYRYKLEWYQ